MFFVLRWPEGKYCVYMKGSRCPAGLEKGFVIWDDENKDNQNTAGGELPEGHYSDDTKIYFCCSTSGAVEQPITLPSDKPFFLYAYDSIKCQNVSYPALIHHVKRLLCAKTQSFYVSTRATACFQSLVLIPGL